MQSYDNKAWVLASACPQPCRTHPFIYSSCVNALSMSVNKLDAADTFQKDDSDVEKWSCSSSNVSFSHVKVHQQLK